jgi:hypothetical protein
MGKMIFGKNYNLIIGTTAVTRPDLHNKVFPKYFEFLKNINWLWYIGIDNLDIGVSCEYTRDNILSLYEEYKSPNNDIVFKLNDNRIPNKESFYKNALNLVDTIWAVENNSKILWLEDDWLCDINEGILTLKELSNIGSYDYMQLVKRHDGNIVSFNPGIWGRGLFKDVCVDKIHTYKDMSKQSPEKVCVFPVKDVKKKVNNFIQRYCFVDVGREWTKNNGMHRTFKKEK